MTGSNTWVDGNALAGPLQEVFSVDVTAAVARCDGCGRTGPIAEARVYDRAPGLVARCPGCDLVVVAEAVPARGAEKLVDQGGQRQRHALGPGGGKREAQVLVLERGRAAAPEVAG